MEVMNHLESVAKEAIDKFLKPIDTNWQPTDLLPDSSILDTFFEKVRALQEQAKGLSYDLLAVLVGDTITEEALPTYESWIMGIEGINGQSEDNGWKQWTRLWTAEENRHGDVLNKYLYLSGRINMREMETSTQYLIADGFDIKTGNDPYRNFVYTSFQELATNISHRRVASLAKKEGDGLLSRICGIVAADEARHAKAYMTFIKHIFEVDPSQMMLAFEDMMRKKIVMPAHFLRETGQQTGALWGHFTDAAQRLGVYTAMDYASILRELLVEWNIQSLTGLDGAAEKARDYVMRLPDRLERIAERIETPRLEYEFKWIAVN
ncbi:MAG: acyl-ACP desaturase [Spirosomataceae bacterium]